VRFLTKRFVVAYQARLIDLFGGSHGLRDEGLLDSALAQPEAAFEGEYLHRDVWEMAAAYAFHLCRNHPFIDGNKRIAAVALGTFLSINGQPARFDEVDLYLAVMAVAEGRLDKSGLAVWLRRTSAA
jgi:death-on-curing protein